MDAATTILIASAVGSALTLVTSIVKRWVTLGRRANFVLAFALSLLAVVLWDISDGGLEAWSTDFLARFGLTFTMAQAVYKLVIKEYGVDARIEGSES